MEVVCGTNVVTNHPCHDDPTCLQPEGEIDKDVKLGQG